MHRADRTWISSGSLILGRLNIDPSFSPSTKTADFPKYFVLVLYIVEATTKYCNGRYEMVIVGLSIFQGGGLGTMGPGTVVPQYLSTLGLRLNPVLGTQSRNIPSFSQREKV